MQRIFFTFLKKNGWSNVIEWKIRLFFFGFETSPKPKYFHAKKSKQLPKMMGFQASGSAPLVKDKSISNPETIATAIRIGNPVNKEKAVLARELSNGKFSSVSDSEIINAYKILGKEEGIFCEPASAASVAGLLKIKEDGHKIVGISAPARSSTILNFCNINSENLDYIAEKSTLKIGKFTPGSHIEVVDDNQLVIDQPDFALLLSWHLSDSIVAKIRDDGFKGKIILPLPEPKII